MRDLVITGVPEHFNFPWTLISKNQPLESVGLHIQWIEESRGSGKMLEALDAGETDLAIVLTESFFKKSEVDPELKILGLFVKSPLNWGIHLAPESNFEQPNAADAHRFLISRRGSGSELMAKVLADREGWDAKSLEFELVDNLPGALHRMKSHQNEYFLWEKFTTKPYVDSGEMKRIGEVPSPWPCFVIVGKESTIRRYESALAALLGEVYKTNLHITQDPSTPDLISSHYGLSLADVNEWICQTEWQLDHHVSREILQQSVDQMLHFGIIQQPAVLGTVFYPGWVSLD